MRSKRLASRCAGPTCPFEGLREQAVFLLIERLFQDRPEVEEAGFDYIDEQSRLAVHVRFALEDDEGMDGEDLEYALSDEVEFLGDTGPWDVQDYVNHHGLYDRRLMQFLNDCAPTSGNISSMADTWLGKDWERARHQRLAETLAGARAQQLEGALASAPERARLRF